MEVGSLTPSACSFTPRNMGFALYRRLGRHQRLSGWAQNFPPEPEFNPRSVQDVATRYTDPQPYTGIETEMNMAVLAGFLAHLFERSRKRRHGVLPNNLREVEGEYF
jgi:hypothetical protein